MSADQQPFVTVAQSKGVVTLTLNRGERFNALSMDMIMALQSALNTIAADSAARVVVLAAAGRGFCAGHDLRELQAHRGDVAWQRDLFDRCSKMMISLTEMPQPVIARVHGLATAAGCQLVSMCDLAIAAESALFALPGVNVGVFCSTPVVGVARNILRKQAMEMLLTGAPIDAATAARRGLINRVVSLDALDREIAELSDAIVARSAAVIGAGKRVFYQQIDRSLAEAYALAGEAMVCNLGLEDAAEGMQAFIDKRAAEWRHR